MTFDDYIKNPMGKKNMVFSNMEMYRTMYNDKLGKVLLRETGRINYKLYKNGDDFIIHMKIPSETIPKFYYDTVVKFSTINPVVKMDKNLRKYDVQFFSNDPSFCFTFAHAFRENDLFIEMLKPKMSKLAIKKEAKERNPGNTVGYVKSLFFMYLIMNSRGLFEKVNYNTYGTKLDKKVLLDSIMHADDKIEARQAAKPPKKEQAKKPVAKQPSPRENTNRNNTTQPSHGIANTKRTNTTKRTSTVKRK